MTLSPRLAAILESLPLQPGQRILEIGCGPGGLARAMAERVGNGFVLGIDRSAKAIADAKAASKAGPDSGGLAYRQVAIEDFELEPGERPFDMVIAVRVGALDGRHPEAEVKAMKQIAAVLKPGGRLFVDGNEVSLRPSPRT